jgi:hypothetical protein
LSDASSVGEQEEETFQHNSSHGENNEATEGPLLPHGRYTDLQMSRNTASEHTNEKAFDKLTIADTYKKIMI